MENPMAKANRSEATTSRRMGNRKPVRIAVIKTPSFSSTIADA
jgi:hypothetical protein